MRLKPTIEDMQALARDRDGECLSIVYLGMTAKHHWRCGNGHEWEARPADVKNGGWCPNCANAIRNNNRKNSIEACQVIARERGGECLSVIYQYSKSKLIGLIQLADIANSLCAIAAKGDDQKRE